MVKKDYTQYSKQELIEEVTKLSKRKKYGLVWEPKEEDIEIQCRNELPILNEVKDKEIKTDSDSPTNILIEGDNYHSLSVLNYTHKGKIDVIYIDPPYNTGAKDWKYNNHYVDNNDTYRHSKWISMMSKRIILSKKLLDNDGVLVCAIDDYEIFTLGLLLDEIFGEKNRIGIVPVRNNPPGRAISKYFATQHEYYLFYAKDRTKVRVNSLITDKVDSKKYKYKDEISLYNRKSLSMRGHGSIHDRPKNYYPIFVSPNLLHITLREEPGYHKVLPHLGSNGEQRVWDYPTESMKKLIIEGNIEAIINAKNKVSIYKKDRFNIGKKPKSLWLNSKYDSSAYGAIFLKKMFNNKKVFDYPKSFYAVMDAIVASTTKNDATVLDFFAGSGTTAQAVLELNKIDDGNRKFIICTNNEVGISEELEFKRKYGQKDQSLRDLIDKKPEEWAKWSQEFGICSSVTYPRVNNIINGYKYENKKIDGFGGNLKYYITTTVKSDSTDKSKKELVNKAVDMICLKESCFEEVINTKAYSIYINPEICTGVLLDITYVESFKKELLKQSKPIHIYIFSLTDDNYDEDFEDIKHVTITPVPSSILKTYRKIHGVNK